MELGIGVDRPKLRAAVGTEIVVAMPKTNGGLKNAQHFTHLAVKPVGYGRIERISAMVEFAVLEVVEIGWQLNNPAMVGGDCCLPV